MIDRFLATTESYAHPVYKQKIVDVGKENSTEYTDVFGRARWHAPHRVVKTPFFETWKNEIGADESEEGQPAIGTTTIFGKVHTDIISLPALIETSLATSIGQKIVSLGLL